MIFIAGTPQPVRKSTEVTYDPQRGVQTTERWESAGDNLQGLAYNFANAGVAYSFTPRKDISELVATYGGTSPANQQPDIELDSWEVQVNHIQKDLFEHPKARAISADVVAQMRKGLKEDKKASELSPALTGDAAVLYDLYQRGTTHFELAQYVVRHTTNVGPTYAKNISDSNVEKIYTTAQLKSECSNAALWARPIPARLLQKIDTIQSQLSAAQSGYMWGWKKLGSPEAQAANGRINITTEYWLEQWSTWIYSAVT